MADNTTNTQQVERACPKDCRKCGMVQQLYCVTRMTFDSYEGTRGILERLSAIEQRLNIIGGSETDLIAPMVHERISDDTIVHPDE